MLLTFFVWNSSTVSVTLFILLFSDYSRVILGNIHMPCITFNFIHCLRGSMTLVHVKLSYVFPLIYPLGQSSFSFWMYFTLPRLVFTFRNSLSARMVHLFKACSGTCFFAYECACLQQLFLISSRADSDGFLGAKGWLSIRFGLDAVSFFPYYYEASPPWGVGGNLLLVVFGCANPDCYFFKGFVYVLYFWGNINDIW